MYLPTRLPTDETETREQSPFTLDALIAWLRTKNPEETYCYMDNGHCLIGQYFTHARVPFSHIGGDIWWNDKNETRELSEAFALAAVEQPHTFGAALSRALAIRGK